MNKKHTSAEQPIIKIENVQKHFGRVQALRGVSLEVKKAK
ncbi:Glutamate transport ATP-binding protein [Dehalococcoides mccartyi]|uniref:Glutamate transport ATP-binding protein n=1 Tax=Dehalococcoides mccartyi TaxID=61435 RepID=A0A328ETM5_9CHLR|nr:Glutamate transport ATP-binding protein [Dehalococcoides mccartyi]